MNLKKTYFLVIIPVSGGLVQGANPEKINIYRWLSLKKKKKRFFSLLLKNKDKRREGREMRQGREGNLVYL